MSSSQSTWTNWAGDQTCSPTTIVRPTNLDEVIAALGHASERELTVRVVGAGHSFTDIVLTDGMMLSLDRMNKVLDIDRASGLVHVEAGITHCALGERLDGEGLALPILGDVDVQSLAGATATATHGTGVSLQNLSAGIVSMKFVPADGSILEVSEHDDVVCRTGRRLPRMIPRLNRLASRLAGTSERVDRSHLIFASRRDVRLTEMEYALPREHAAAAVRAVRDIVDHYGFSVPLPMEVRFGAPDDAWLSPAFGHETCYIAVHMFEGMEWAGYFRAVEEALVGFGGRPHWGKRHFQNAAGLSTQYPEWERFALVRRRLDPRAVFTNSYVERVLGSP